jgi:hypothetical protein
MGDLQTAYWLLVVMPAVVSLAVRMALRIWGKNLRPLIDKSHQRLPPCHPPPSSDIEAKRLNRLSQACSKAVRKCYAELP